MSRWLQSFLSICLLAYCSKAEGQIYSVFVPVTPCRVADTGQATGPFGGPALGANSTRTFAIPSSPCGIPANASAYSLNVTVIPSGSQVGYLAIWPTGQPQPLVSTLNDISPYPLANAAIVAAGTNGGINVFVQNVANVIIDIDGYFVAASNSTSTAIGIGASNAGNQNTAIGFDTLQFNSGSSNTGVGASSLAANAAGNNNTALGVSSLMASALGSANTAVGANAMLSNVVGNDNTALGFSALDSNTTGSNNVAIGATSLWNEISGGSNVAVGFGSLYADTAGSWNIALGYQAGNAITSGNYNIDIGNSGLAGDSGVIRIGTAGSQATAYLAGVVNSTVSGIAVVVNANGQLGVQASSRRFKEQIQDIGNASEAVYKLRPVSFFYRPDSGADSDRRQYGLIAEEVEKFYPELVIHDEKGRPYALAYQELPALLLGAVQKQRQTIEDLQSQVAAESGKIEQLLRRLSSLERNAEEDKKIVLKSGLSR